ncbi:hypothetical protein BC827DRAFT_1156084 [Russula dissimulans]|nr:hypothetical protein BC827DRAFT_1156084 [Russula dissimulans]
MGRTTGSLGVELNQAKNPEGEDRPLPDHESDHESLMVKLDQPTGPQRRTTDCHMATGQSQKLKGLSYISWWPETKPRRVKLSTRKAMKEFGRRTTSSRSPWMGNHYCQTTKAG